MSSTATATNTYTVADIEKVARKFAADLIMIAQSTGAMDEVEARKHAHDIEALAAAGYLRSVDLTLIQLGRELRAARYEVNTSAGGLSSSRPGGVLWPRVSGGTLRIVVSHTAAYTEAAREKMQQKLKLSWSPSYDDTSHSTLTAGGGRDYVSNGWGLQRKDFS
jgi:hypothetical protein